MSEPMPRYYYQCSVCRAKIVFEGRPQPNPDNSWWWNDE